jgi:hypothetical protein
MCSLAGGKQDIAIPGGGDGTGPISEADGYLSGDPILLCDARLRLQKKGQKRGRVGAI